MRAGTAGPVLAVAASGISKPSPDAQSPPPPPPPPPPSPPTPPPPHASFLQFTPTTKVRCNHPYHPPKPFSAPASRPNRIVFFPLFSRSKRGNVMAETSLVHGTPSSHPQAPQGQSMSHAATEPGDDLLNAMGPPAPHTSPAPLGRTRVQTILLQEGESGEGRPPRPNLPDAANERQRAPPSPSPAGTATGSVEKTQGCLKPARRPQPSQWYLPAKCTTSCTA